jgi:hypothetical protein
LPRFSEYTPPLVVDADPPGGVLGHRLTGIAGLLDEVAVAEIRVLVVGVVLGVGSVGLDEFGVGDGVGQASGCRAGRACVPGTSPRRGSRRRRAPSVAGSAIPADWPATDTPRLGAERHSPVSSRRFGGVAWPTPLTRWCPFRVRHLRHGLVAPIWSVSPDGLRNQRQPARSHTVFALRATRTTTSRNSRGRPGHKDILPAHPPGASNSDVTYSVSTPKC